MDIATYNYRAGISINLLRLLAGSLNNQGTVINKTIKAVWWRSKLQFETSIGCVEISLALKNRQTKATSLVQQTVKHNALQAHLHQPDWHRHTIQKATTITQGYTTHMVNLGWIHIARTISRLTQQKKLSAIETFKMRTSSRLVTESHFNIKLNEELPLELVCTVYTLKAWRR